MKRQAKYQSRRRLAIAIAAALAAISMAACSSGGGSNVRSDGAPPPPPPPPANVTINVPGGAQDLKLAGLPTAGTLTKVGAGMLFLGGDSTFTDSVQINEGTLFLVGGAGFGNLRSNVFVNPGAEFDFDGNVFGSVFNRGMMVVFNPDGSFSYGQPRINGDYRQGADGTLRVFLDGLLTITGNVVIEGGTLEIRLPVFSDDNPWDYIAAPQESYSYTPQILHADGSITGQFTHVILPSLFLSGIVNYGLHDITMTLVPVSAASVIGAAGIGDAVSLASAEHLDQAFSQADALSMLAPNALSTKQQQFMVTAGVVQRISDVSQAVSSLDSLSGQGYASTRNLLLEHLDRQSPQLTERLDSMRAGVGPGMWFDSQSRLRRLVAAGNLETNFAEQGFMVGVDHAVAENLVVGAAIGQDEAGMDFDRMGGQASLRMPSALVYGNYWRGSWYATGQLQTTHARLKMQRWIDLGDGNRHRAASEFGLDRIAVHLEAGRDYRIGRSRITPFIGLDASSLRSDPFTELGDTGFELTAPAARGGRTSAELGVRIGRDWGRARGAWARLDVGASYRHGLHTVNDDIRAAYVGAIDSQFEIPALLASLDSRRLGLDLSAGRGDAWKSFLRYDWNQSGRDQYSTWLLGAEWKF